MIKIFKNLFGLKTADSETNETSNITSFKFPKTIKVNRYEDYHTHFIGTNNSTNQFFIYQTFVFTKAFHDIEQTEDWKDFRNEYAVCYEFNTKGELVNHDHFNFGKTSEIDQQKIDFWIQNKLEEFGNYKFTDIRVQPFEILIDNNKFGLIPNEESKMIEMQPGNTIAFSSPWDGEYDT